jgi:hypothetical protein
VSHHTIRLGRVKEFKCVGIENSVSFASSDYFPYGVRNDFEYSYFGFG